MKKILLAAAALAVIASPALAKSARQTAPSYGQAVPFGAWQAAPFGAYAQTGPSAFVPSYGNTLGGDYVGTDPDPNVRLQLLKDAESRD
jgi:opacity protein-like surface antigen